MHSPIQSASTSQSSSVQPPKTGVLANLYSVTTPIKDLSNKFWNQCAKISQCALGQYMINSSKENVIETVGSVIGALAGNRATAIILEHVGSQLGYQAGRISTVAVALLIGYAARQQMEKQGASFKNEGATALGILSLGISGMVLPNLGEQIGSVLGEYGGTFVGSQLGGILGGFGAIRLYGSDETLISERLAESYAIKCVQAIAANNLLGFLFTTSNPILSAMQEQLVGSIAYHSLADFKPLLKTLNEGKLLDDQLYNLPEITPEEMKHLNEEVSAYLSKDNIWEKIGFTEDQSKQIVSGVKTLMEQITDWMSAEFEKINTSKADPRMVLNITFQAFNDYMAFLSGDKSLQQANKEFIKDFLKIDFTKSTKDQEINALKAKLDLALNQKNPIYNLNTLIDMLPLENILKKNTMDLTEVVLSQLKEKEVQLFGISVTDDKLIQCVQELIDIHSKFLCSFLFNQINKLNDPIHEGTIRQLYSSVLDLVSNYYRIALETQLPTVFNMIAKVAVEEIRGTLQHQIKNAELKDTTLKNFIDI